MHVHVCVCTYARTHAHTCKRRWCDVAQEGCLRPTLTLTLTLTLTITITITITITLTLTPTLTQEQVV